MKDFDETRFKYLQQVSPSQAEEFRADYERAVSEDFCARHPEFDGTAENAKLLTETVKELEAHGMPLGPSTMDAAHDFLTRQEHEQLERQASRLSNRELEERLRAAGEPVYKSTI